jgi:hypothetical protein
MRAATPGVRLLAHWHTCAHLHFAHSITTVPASDPVLSPPGTPEPPQVSTEPSASFSSQSSELGLYEMLTELNSLVRLFDSHQFPFVSPHALTQAQEPGFEAEVDEGEESQGVVL